MADIRTVSEVTVNDQYKVRVARADDDYEAAVVATKKSPFEIALSIGNSSNWGEIENAPRVIRSQQYVAIGAAVEAYQEQGGDSDESDDEGNHLQTDEILADVLRRIWGSNPQAPVNDFDVELLLKRLAREYGRDTVQAAIDRCGSAWEDIEVPGGEA